MPWWVAELQLAKEYQGAYQGEVDFSKEIWFTRAMILSEARGHAARMGIDKKKK